MKYIEHYDEDLDTIFEIPELDLTGFESFDEFMESAESPAILHPAVLSALHTAAELEITHVPVIAIAGSDLVVELEEAAYLEKLEECLQYYSELEEYEICGILTTIKEKIIDLF
jgi:hypothetical protein